MTETAGKEPSASAAVTQNKPPSQKPVATPVPSPKKKREAYVPPTPPPSGNEDVEPPAPSSNSSPNKAKKAYVPPAPLPALDQVVPSQSPKKSQSSPRSGHKSISKVSQSTSTSRSGARGQSDEDPDGSISQDDFLLPSNEVPSSQRPDVLGSVADLLGDNTDIFDIIGQEHRPDFYQSSGDEDNSIRGNMSRNVSTASDSKDSAESSLDDMLQDELDASMPQVQVGLHETPQPSSGSGMRFDELYRLKGVLGTGAFSTVREGYHRANVKQSYAVKCINRKKLSEEDEAALLDEVGILKELRHAHIIRLYDFFEEPSTYYLVMERMRGGELFDRIVAKAYYNEKEARDTCKIILEAVGHCHDK